MGARISSLLICVRSMMCPLVVLKCLFELSNRACASCVTLSTCSSMQPQPDPGSGQVIRRQILEQYRPTVGTESSWVQNIQSQSCWYEPLGRYAVYADKKKVKKSLNRPLWILEVENPRISGQPEYEGEKVVGPTHRPPLPPSRYPWCPFLIETESTPGP